MQEMLIKNKFLFIGVLGALVIVFYLFRLQANATPTTYYFNNAVDTNPATLGNYWDDYAATDPAGSLPNLAEDILTILPSATYNGNATFNGDAVNEGTVTGDATFNDTSTNEGTVSGSATFNGDLSENNGTLEGDITRRYSSNIATTRAFESDWVIQADGAIVDISGATFGDVYFSRLNGGYFISSIELVHASVTGNILSLSFDNPFDENLDGFSGMTYQGDFSDISVTVDGSPVTILSSASSGVSFTLNQTVSVNSEVRLDYEIGDNPIMNQEELNVNPIDNLLVPVGAPLTTIAVGNDPVYSTAVGTKLYVSNKAGNSVSVINTTTDTVIATISVGTSPENSVLVGTKLYVNNLGSASVSVINTVTDTVVDTITVGNGPYFSVVVGTKIYVSNTGTNTVSVINTLTDTVTATITVGSAPWFPGVVGTKIYVPSRTANTVSVIDAVTDTVVTTISVAAGSTTGTKAVVIGTKVYVGRQTSMAVIDSVTDTVIATPSLGSVSFGGPQPYFSAVVGTKLYVMRRNGVMVPVIDSTTDAITTSISTAGTPYSATVIGEIIYINSVGGNSVYAVDTSTDRVVGILPIGNEPFYSTAVGNKIYTSNFSSDNVTVIDTTQIATKFPVLTSFSSTTLSGSYSVDDQINITANFSTSLASGSTMTVILNNGASVVLNTVSGSSLSGIYIVADSTEFISDLSVESISSASVTDVGEHTRTSYSLPSSQGSLVAENSFITRNIGDSKNIVIGQAYSIQVGDKPYQVSPAVSVNGNNYMYVANQEAATVSVIRLSDHRVISTIPVGLEPYGITTAVISGNTYVYVVNTGSDTVSVIDTSTNTVTSTVSVGVKPYYAATIGTNIYITNSQPNTVSVINGLTNTVSATIPVGLYPRGIKAYGTNLYVANYGDPNYSGGNTVSVINSLTNTVTETIELPSSIRGPRGLTVHGGNVYVSNFRSNNVSIINATTNTLTATVSVGAGPRGITGLGTKVYVENFDDGTISIIDTETSSLSGTIKVGHSPTGMGIFGTDIYISQFQDNTVSILDTTSNSIRKVSPITIGGIGIILGGGGATTVDPILPPSIETPISPEETDFSEIPKNEIIPEPIISYDLNLMNRLKGMFLLASEDRGQLWYVDPDSGKRYEANNKTSLRIFIETALGITNSNLEKIPINGSGLAPSSLAQRLQGKILLQTEDLGKTWYVNFTGFRFLITINNITELAKNLAIGISNQNLEKIEVQQ